MTKKIVSICLLIASIAMIGTGVYLMNSNKYMFETSLGRVLSYVNKINEGDKTFIEGLDGSDKYKITTNSTLTYIDNKMGVSGDLYFNSSNQLYVDLDGKVEGEINENLGLIGLLDEKKVFLKIKDVMDEFYYTDIEDSISNQEVVDSVNYEEISKLSKKDLKILTDHLKKSISKNITNKDLTKTKEALTLDGKKVSMYKLSLKMTDKMITSISKDYLKALSNDTKAIKVLQKIDKNITKSDLEDAVKSMGESTSNDEYLVLSFYCKVFGDVTRIELSTSDGLAVDMSLSVDFYQNKNKHNTTAVTAEMNGSSIKFEKAYTSKDKANINITVVNDEGNASISGTLVKNNSTFDLALSCTYNGETLGDVTFKISTVTKNKEYKLETKISIGNTEGNKIVLNSVNNIYLNEDIPSIDTDNAKDIKEISDEEREKLQEFLQKFSKNYDSSDIEESEEV